MASPKTIEHGVELGYFYPVVAGADGSASYGPALKQIGMKSITISTEQELTNFYADNVTHLTIAGVKVVSGEMGWFQLEPKIYTDFLGYELNANGSLSDTGVNKPFAFSWASLVTDEYGGNSFVLYTLASALSTPPEIEKVTDEEAVEAEILVIPYQAKSSAAALSDTGKESTLIKYTCAAGTTAAQVMAILEKGPLLPDTVIPAPVPPARASKNV